MNSAINDVFVLMISTIVGLNAISIPISYQIVSQNLKPFINRDSHRILINEHAFQNNLWCSLSVIAIYFLPLFFDFFPHKEEMQYHGKYMIYGQICFLIYSALAFVMFIFYFIRFSMRVYEYSSNAEFILFEQSRGNIDRFLGKETGDEGK